MTRSATTAVEDAVLDGLIARLDLEQKVRLVSGADFWSTPAEPAIGLRRMVVSDGPSGIRGELWDERDPSVSLPSGTAVAATWDPDLVGRLAGLLAAEARRKGVDVALGPTINLHRSPLGGRHFECFSEDPLLTGRLAAAYVVALQALGVGACPKHYVANDSETERFTLDARVDERTLRELYLAPFEAAVRAGAWTVMSAYNGVNGVTMTENPLLDEPLKGEWGFDGVVVSDWTAVRSTDGAAAGTDLAMPGPSAVWGEPLVAAVRDGRVGEGALDGKLRRILRLAARVGALADVPAPSHPAPAHPAGDGDADALVREAAAAAMVLVRNDGTLPVAAIGSVAVLGPNAADGRMQGGGSATVIPTHAVSPLDGLLAAVPDGVTVRHAVGVRTGSGIRPVGVDLAADPATGEPGLGVRFLDTDGRVVRVEHRTAGHVRWLGPTGLAGVAVVELSARVTADRDGTWQVGFAGAGPCRFAVDGEAVFDEVVGLEGSDLAEVLLDPPRRSFPRELAAGQVVELVLTHPVAPERIGASLALGVAGPQPPDDVEFDRAVELARTSDVAVVVVGTTEEIESEGHDRTTLALPGRQDDLVRAVAAVNPRTVVVVNSGGPVELPWRDSAAAVLLTWFPGQQFGHALADVLTGRREPGGRLPTTWPVARADVPVLDTAPVDGRLHYAEGLHIGYRAWARHDVAPAYPFGFGLGYTTWTYTDLDPGAVAAGADVEVRVTVRNTGARRGREVVQLYLARPGSAVERPVRWLAGFAAVEADPGKTAVATVAVAARALAHWSVADGGWRTESGSFTVLAGGCSAELPLSAVIEVP